MPYRYTEEDLADIKARQNAKLDDFQRNSGRGLPAATLEAMERASGVKLDNDGAPVPKKLRKPKKASLPVQSEEEECVALFQWAQVKRWRGRPISEFLVMIPNGAYLGADPKTRAITMGKMKAAGLMPGAYDYLLAVPNFPAQCAGLWLEMKRTKGGDDSDDQKAFRRRMTAIGYRCEVTKGWVNASRVIEEHLDFVP